MSTLAIQTISSSLLHTLAVDHFSNDYDILSRIAVAAPNLHKLKLNEKAHPQRRRGHLRRPWNDIRQWHDALLRLASLDELMVKTSISIARPPRTDQDVVTAWAAGVGRHAVTHPRLFHIAIIQKDTTAASGLRLDHWFKDEDGVWERGSTWALGRTHSFTI